MTEIWFSPNTPRTTRKVYAEQFGFTLVQEFGKYLGIFIDSPKDRNMIGKEVVDKLNKKLQGWKVKLLSQAGRLALCKSLLESLPMSNMATMLFSRSQVKQTEECIKKFWWGWFDLIGKLTYCLLGKN